MTALTLGWAGAEEVKPEMTADAVHISTPVYRPNFKEFNPPMGEYTYTVSWERIPAATVKVNIESNGPNYKVNVSAKTYSGIDLLYKLRYKAEGLLSGIDLTPVKTLIEERENSRVKTAQITFHDSGLIETVRETKGKDTKVLNFVSDNFTLDPFSAAFIARGLDWKLGDSKEFDTFNGKSRYLITLTAVDKKMVKLNGESREVWVISPQVKNLVRPDADKKLREAKIYVTADEKREILKIESSVFIGTVYTEMDSFVPSPSEDLRLVRRLEASRLEMQSAS